MISILVVDPSESDRTRLTFLLEQAGYDVLASNDWGQAFSLLEQYSPDLVLTELSSPMIALDEFVVRIKSLDHPSYFPSICVVTDCQQPNLIASVLEEGVDDFLQKPYVDSLLLAKVGALLRNVSYYADLRLSNANLLQLHQSLRMEQHIAEKIFDQFVSGPSRLVGGVTTKITPTSIFNGDVFLSAVSPAGKVLTLLGDFTGHGLPAAIGAIPVAEVFYSMVHKGFSLLMIIKTINAKLKEILPVELFFSCILVQICPIYHHARILNAGMQPVLLVDSEKNTITEFSSSMIPLGILNSESLEFHFETFSITASEYFVFYTDGVVESRNQQDQFFGVEQVKKCLLDTDGDLDKLYVASKKFSVKHQFDDDVSLIKLDVNQILALGEGLQESVQKNVAFMSPGKWTQDFCFDAKMMPFLDKIIETVVEAILAILPIVQYKEDLYLLFTHILRSTLEQDILQLELLNQQEQRDFEAYLAIKKQRLKALTNTMLRIQVEHQLLGENGGELNFCFSYSEGSQPNGVLEQVSEYQVNKPLMEDQLPLLACDNALLHKLCHRLAYDPEGHVTEATYRWGTINDI